MASTNNDEMESPTLSTLPNGAESALLIGTQRRMRSLARELAKAAVRCRVVSEDADLLRHIRTGSIDVVVLYCDSMKASLRDLIRLIRQGSTAVRIVVLTDRPSIAAAVEAIKSGADDYVSDAVSIKSMGSAVERSSERDLDSSRLTPMRRLDWEHIQMAMSQAGGNVSAAARNLGMHRRTLQRKLARAL